MENSQKDSEQVKNSNDLEQEEASRNEEPKQKPEETQQNQPKPEKAKSGGGKLATLLSLVALGVGGTSMYMQVNPNANIPYLSDKMTTNANSATADTTELESKIAAVDAKIIELAQQSPTADEQESNEELTEQFRVLQEQVEQIQNAASVEAQSAAESAQSSVPDSAQVDELVAQQQKLAEDIERYSESNQQLNSTIEELQQKHYELTGRVSTFSEQLPDAAEAEIWQLRDIELTLKQANRSLNAVDDIPAVLALMQQASTQLQSIQQVDVTNVKNRLDDDIVALQQVQAPDRGEVISRIEALAQSAASLPLIGDKTQNTGKPVSDEAQSKEGNAISEAGAGFLKSITDMIEIKKDGQAIRPIVSNELREIARQRTALILESAMLAYLSEDTELMAARLQSATNWVQEHFDQGADATQSWLQSVAQISGSVTQIELPDITSSLEELSAAMQEGG